MQYRVDKLPVYLKTPFGTSHSVTTMRTNALITCSAYNVEGIAEIGLPPKKDGCYYCDYDDIQTFFMSDFADAKGNKNLPKLLPVDITPHELFFYELNKLDLIVDRDEIQACKCGFECALFDWYCKLNNTTVADLWHIKLSNYEKRNFFTLSLLDDKSIVLGMINQGLEQTPNLKIKVGTDLNYVADILSAIDQMNLPGLISLDCNCSWTPQIAMNFFDLVETSLKHLKHKIYMLEQPFPIDAKVEDWYLVKEKGLQIGIHIFADESMKSAKDLTYLQGFVTGVNVKLEKTGGYRNAIDALQQAQALGLHTWIGIMIGTSLNANQAFQLLKLSNIGGDIDGPLHVTKESEIVQLRFQWGEYQSADWGMIKQL